MHVHAGVKVWVRRPAAAGAAAGETWVPAVVTSYDDPSRIAVLRLEGGGDAAAARGDLELRGDDAGVQARGRGGGFSRAGLVPRARAAHAQWAFGSSRRGCGGGCALAGGRAPACRCASWRCQAAP
jgi:hypothetical protein